MNGEGLIIDLGGDDFELTRYNTHLYTFIGHLATRNHIFVITAETETETAGVYVWQTFHTEPFHRIREHMEQHNYSQYLNLNEVAEVDEDAFQRAIKREMDDVGDFIPDDFI